MAIYKSTGNTRFVVEILGHSDMNTTEKYYIASKYVHRHQTANSPL